MPSIFQGRCRSPESKALPWLEWPGSSSALHVARALWSKAAARASRRNIGGSLITHEKHFRIESMVRSIRSGPSAIESFCAAKASLEFWEFQRSRNEFQKEKASERNALNSEISPLRFFCVLDGRTVGKSALASAGRHPRSLAAASRLRFARRWRRRRAGAHRGGQDADFRVVVQPGAQSRPGHLHRAHARAGQ